MKNSYNTYNKSGVNMAAADKLVKHIAKISRKTYKKFDVNKSYSNIDNWGNKKMKNTSK